MSNNKQTAVDYLVENLRLSHKEAYNDLYEVIEQAKAMHNQEMKEMYVKGIENYDPTFKRKDTQPFGGNNEQQ